MSSSLESPQMSIIETHVGRQGVVRGGRGRGLETVHSRQGEGGLGAWGGGAVGDGLG
jgi:hypothetical protein